MALILLASLLFTPCLLQCLASDTVEEQGQKFLEENKKRDSVITLPSGVQYEVLSSGPDDGPFPNASSVCVCHFSGKLLSGIEFDSSSKRSGPGLPANFSHCGAPSAGAIAGWTEALQLMRPGDKWKLFISSELGYGEREHQLITSRRELLPGGSGGSTIPGNSVLVYEVELVHVMASEGGLLEMLGLDAYPQFLFIVPAVVLLLLFQYLTRGGGKRVQLSEVAGATGNISVFFSITVGEKSKPDRVEIELFREFCPKTVENFRALCTGEKGEGKSGKKLHFKGSKFHRIIPGFMCQGGDFTQGNGNGGESIYGADFEDEWTNGHISHSKAGLLSMANAGKNTNGSQFFITNAATGSLDGKHVVFGQVTHGMEVIKQIERLGNSRGHPSETVVIVDCGEMKSKTT